MASGSFRRRDPAQIVNELEVLAERHDTQHFMFVDEIMTLPSMRDVASELVRRDCQFYWYAETRFAKGWTQETADLLHRSGCRRLNFGLESFNQRILDRMQKQTRVDYIPDNIEVCLRAGIPVHLFVIIGFPGETEREALRTLRFVQKTIQRSTELFELPYSTWGASPFILDVHSPVAQEPGRYGIQIMLPAANQDLTQKYSYEVEGGMSIEEIQDFFRKKSPGNNAPSRIRSELWFHESTSKECEEEIFLRACHNAGCPAPRTRGAALWVSDYTENYLSLDATTVIRRSNHSMFSFNTAPVIALYLGSSSYLLELPDQAEPWLHQLRSVRRCSEHVSLGAEQYGLDSAWMRETIGILARFGFLEWHDSNPRKQIQGPADLDLRDVIFRQESLIYHEPLFSSRGGILVSHITGKIAKLNETGYALWQICKKGLDYPTLSELACGNLYTLLGLLYELVDFGFLYVETIKGVPDNYKFPAAGIRNEVRMSVS